MVVPSFCLEVKPER